MGNTVGGNGNARGLLMALSERMTAADRTFSQSRGRGGVLLGGIALGIYTLFTLLPNSGLMVMAWPYPLLLLVGWVSAATWGIVQWWQARPARWLGMGLDLALAMTAIALILSAIASRWPQTGAWYAVQFLLYAITLSGLAQWLSTPHRRLWLWRMTAWLGLVFSLESLLLWWVKTLSPQLAEIQHLRQLGLPAELRLGQIELQNIWPIFHQNYVAGFLLLTIPAAAGLVWLHRRSPLKWLWLGAVAVELGVLWSTQSRGAWLGLTTMLVTGGGIVIWRRVKSWRWRWGGIALMVGGTVAFILGNPRLSLSLAKIGQGSFEHFAFRAAALEATWTTIKQYLLFGSGPGTGAWAYLESKPAWTGLAAQTMAHLHSTPLQLLTELGGLGLLVMGIWLVVLARAGWRVLKQAPSFPSNGDRCWAWVLVLSLLGYTVESLTDFQLDVVPIAGALAIAIAGLASLNWQLSDPAVNVSPRQQTLLGGIGGVAIVLAVALVMPRYTAWGVSSQGLEAYFDNNFVLAETRLQQADRWFSAEPFYPMQLGWLEAKIAREHPDASIRQQKSEEAIAWFERSLERLPADEFVHTNLGYLLLERDPAAAVAHFKRSLQLSPARPAIAAGLGLAYLNQGERQAGLAAIEQEILRHPQTITSPLWQQVLAPETYGQLLASVEQLYADLVPRYPELKFLRINWAMIRWWLGDFEGARQLLTGEEKPLLQAMVEAAAGDRATALELLEQVPSSPASLLLRAWLEPSQADRWLAVVAQIFPQTTTLAPPSPHQSLLEWLQQPAAVLPRQAGRNYLTQGVYRRIDGPNLTDTFSLPANWIVSDILYGPFSTPEIAPDLDRELAVLTD